MTLNTSPPCAYIREVCYNDCSPPPKSVKPSRKPNGAAIQTDSTQQSPPSAEPQTEFSDFLLRLLIAYYLS